MGNVTANPGRGWQGLIKAYKGGIEEARDRGEERQKGYKPSSITAKVSLKLDFLDKGNK